MKTCIKCKIEKEEIHYYKNNNNLEGRCKECRGLSKNINKKIYFDGVLKSCSKCRKIKELLLFHKNKSHKFGYDDYCKECVMLRKPKTTLRFFDGVNKSCNRCKNILPVDKFTFSSHTKNGYQSWCKKCLQNYLKEREENNIQYKIHRQIGRQLRRFLKDRNIKKDKTTLLYLNCDKFELFINHLEINFRPGMTWENWGKLWEIHHIKFKSSFGDDINGIKECWDYNNLIPLWKTTKISNEMGDYTLGNRNISNKIIYDTRNLVESK